MPEQVETFAFQAEIAQLVSKVLTGSWLPETGVHWTVILTHVFVLLHR